MPDETTITPEIRKCLDNCRECNAACLETIPHCLMMGREHAAAEHIGLLMNCASICSSSADFMRTASPFHPQVCGVCADVCAACAEECFSMAGGDATMQACAIACERCADSCREMAISTPR